MIAFAQSAQTLADNGLPSLQEQLLAAAIHAAAVRMRIEQACSADESYALIDQLERAETLRQALERQVAELERTREPWWRRIRR
jgi:hypothetical protein